MQPAVDTLLIATPQLVDPNFQQTVVYLLEVGPTGCMGLIINRPSTWTLGDLWKDCPEPLLDQRLACEGGPVDHARGMLLHNGDGLPGTHRLSPGLALGGDIDAVLELGGICRLFLGHAGWDADQLNAEILHGYWTIRPGHTALALAPKLDVTLWEELVRLPPPMQPASPN